MFKEVGNFVIEDSGNSQLYLSDESIVWPNNLTAPSSEITKCKSCDENCYNGETTKRELFVMISYVLPKYPFTVNSQKLANLTTTFIRLLLHSFFLLVFPLLLLLLLHSAAAETKEELI